MSEQQPSVESIFLAALERTDPDDRSAYLREACGSDESLRNRVQRLLNAHPKAEKFLEPAPQGMAATQAGDVREGPGSTIGPYKLLQQIGEGGFGVVYMAEQEKPIQRRVALKVIKPGMDSKQVIARFEAERQALAMMDHQNIARVFEAGTTETGRPYFVMELVRGVPITEYCDHNKLTLQRRLDLFCQVCHAVQHAHQKGIIHRDIKPSNVMVTLYDGKPVPKVIDFGVSKAIQQKLTERTLFTAYGNLIGTPEYMSPEQAEMSGLDVDTRTDVYSLGVLLYELLTGSTPISREQLNEAGFEEMLRTIREVEPPRPSVRLSQSGEELASISEHRRTEPGKLSRFVRGDLDWIVMRALEKDRTRRYETANGMAADVKRYLEHEAVEASPPSTVYRLRKFARKNRNVVATVASLAVVLIACLIVSLWLAVRFGHERTRALAARETAHNARDIAKAAQAETEQQLIRTRIESIAARALAMKDQSPDLSVLLAVEAVEASRNLIGYVLPTAYESLTAAIGSSCGRVVATRAEFRRGVTFSPDDRQMAIVYDDHTVQVVEIAEQSQLDPGIKLRHQSEVTSLEFSSDGNWLAVGCRDGRLRLWECISSLGDRATPTLVLDGHTIAIENLAISPDSRWVATRSDRKILLWDLTAENIATSGIEVVAFDDRFKTFRFSPDAHWLAIG